MTDARPDPRLRAPKTGSGATPPHTPYIDPRTFGEREDLVGDGMSPIPVIAGLVVTAAIVAGMFFLAA